MVRRTRLTAAQPVSAGAAIEVRDLSKTFALPHQRRDTFKEFFLHPFARMTYERQQALTDVSFTVERGEFFAIMGPNGSGKSTLLKVLAGIYRADRGTVAVGGLLSPFIELGVGFNMELTARDNVRINATLLGLTRREIEEKFDDIVRFAEIERFVDQRLKNYSSGMQMRLAYSIAIQVPFDILLLDEVMAVGDESFQEKCFATFERMRAAGKTIVLVSHSPADVERFSDRVLVLRNGRVVTVAPVDEALEAYRSGVDADIAAAEHVR